MPISLRNTGSILPYLRYGPQENKMLIAGEDGKPREILFLGKSFAIDIESWSMGWLLISEGLRDWKPFPIGSVPPPSPGPNYKRGFSILFYAPKLLASPEPHEMCSSTSAFLSFCERLFNEAEPNFGGGNVPIVKITEAKEIKFGLGKSRELKFEIVKWVPRPAAFDEALAKLKLASAMPDKKAATGGAADIDDNDFDDEDGTAPPKEKPADKSEKTTTEKPKEKPPDKPEKMTTEKPKGPGKKAQPETHSSDLLDDEIPF